MEKPSGPPLGASREYGLDWLRVSAFLVLIFYHSGMMFVTWGWHIENAERSAALEYAMLFFNRWRLGLLFFISGAGVWFSLRHRTIGAFTGERFRRLFVPLAFGMFVVVPPQIYFERLWRGQFTGSYASFYPRVFDFVPYPQGNFSWHHLWFVAYLFVFVTAGLPVLWWLRTAPGQRLIDRLAALLERHPWTLYLVGCPSVAVAMLLGPRWPTTNNLTSDWANLIGSFVTFLWGFVLCSRRSMLDLLERRRHELLAGAATVAIIFFTLRATRTPLPLFGRALLTSYYGFFWILMLVAWFRRYLNRPSPWLSYANEAVYPFYIAHQTIIVAAGFFLIQQPWGIGPKLLAAMAAAFFGSWAVYELARRTAITRLLFGMKTG